MVNNWGGGAYDPERNLLITNFRRFSLFVGLPKAEDVDQEAAKSLMAGMPSGALVYLFSARYRAATDVAARTVLVSSVASMLTLSILLVLMGA